MFDVSHNVANGTTVKTRGICSKSSQAHEVEGFRKEIDSIVHWYIEPMNNVHCAPPGRSFRPAHVKIRAHNL